MTDYKETAAFRSACNKLVSSARFPVPLSFLRNLEPDDLPDESATLMTEESEQAYAAWLRTWQQTQDTDQEDTSLPETGTPEWRSVLLRNLVRANVLSFPTLAAVEDSVAAAADLLHEDTTVKEYVEAAQASGLNFILTLPAGDTLGMAIEAANYAVTSTSVFLFSHSTGSNDIDCYNRNKATMNMVMGEIAGVLYDGVSPVARVQLQPALIDCLIATVVSEVCHILDGKEPFTPRQRSQVMVRWLTYIGKLMLEERELSATPTGNLLPRRDLLSYAGSASRSAARLGVFVKECPEKFSRLLDCFFMREALLKKTKPLSDAANAAKATQELMANLTNPKAKGEHQ